MTREDFDQLSAAQDRPLYDADEEQADVLRRPQGDAYEGSVREVKTVEEAEDLFIKPEFEYRGAIRTREGEEKIALVFWQRRPIKDR